MAALDNSFFQVNSYWNQTSWYGRIYSVPNGLTSLRADYTGSNSLACNQSVAIWNWSTGFWVALDSRSVGPTPVTVSVSPTGTLANFVSNTVGNGDVAVRISCTRGDYASFYASGDQLQIQYTP